jgi:predicted MFS family arabinose efflux permease
MASFCLVLFAYLFSQFFRSFIAIVAADLGRDLGFGPAELGWISAAWFTAFALAQFPVGYLLDTLGPRRTMASLMLSGVVGGLLFAVSGGFVTSMAAMALIGVGCSPILMAGLYIFGRTAAPERFPMLASLLVGLGNIGNLVAASPLAYAAQTFGWRPSMAAVGTLMGLAALLTFLFLPDPPKAERRGGKTPMLGDIGTILRMRALWLVFPIHAVSYAAVATERGLWIGPYLADVHGLDALARGNIAFAMSVGMALGALACGPAARWMGGSKSPAILANAITIGLLLLLGFWTGVPVAIAAFILTGIGFFGLSYSLLLSHGRPFFPDHLLGRGVTFLNFLAIGGAGIMQAVTGQVMDRLLASGQSAPAAYSMIHIGMGLSVLVILLLFLRAPEKPV